MKIIVHGTPEQTQAFKFLWAKFVSGFNPSVHCAKCLQGPYSKVVKVGIAPGEHELDVPSKPWHYFYLCGVTPRWATNLHLAVRPKPGSVARVTAHNGAIFELTDAEAIPIASVPVGTLGKDAHYTTCRNWQFGLQEYA